MTNTPRPTFDELDASETRRLLTRNHVGRIAYSFHGRVDIEPIGYVHADGVIYMRTSPGSKLATLHRAPWVAFEVDEVDGLLDWRSVVAHGTVYVLENAGTLSARASYQSAVDRLRTLDPHAFEPEDLTPDRTVVMQLHIDSMTGRQARSGSSARQRALHSQHDAGRP